MAAQNAFVQASVRGAPSTAVMTTNLTRFAMDIAEIFAPERACFDIQLMQKKWLPCTFRG
jgi:uncharacterized membrane protein YoaK (UPF0700 family)